MRKKQYRVTPESVAAIRAWQIEDAKKRRAEIVTAILDLTEELGRPPLRVDLERKLPMARVTIRTHLRTLLDEGIVTESGAPRSKDYSGLLLSEN